ncbi:MAG: threonyl-tRNA synthetase editing domain-containing protein [Candidatus Bathyarchaeia archaeon]
MRVLQLHCTEFGYSIREDTPVAERPASPEQEEVEDVLVCFTCFEKKDEGRIESLVESFMENIKTDTGRIGCKNVLLYPYAHLSKSLGSPREAKRFLDALKSSLEEEGLEVHKSPFGWYKAFQLHCKGHPLAEAYREY